MWEELLDEDGTLTDGALQALVRQLEESAAMSSSEEARELASELSALAAKLHASIDSSTRRALLDSSDAAATRLYEFGAVDFANQFASFLATVREPEAFKEYLSNAKYRNLLSALKEARLTCSELADRVSEHPETVSRKLKTLREAGLCDYQKIGREVYNYLTPACIGAIGSVAHANRSPQAYLSSLDAVMQGMEPQLQRAPSFSQSIN